jgi:F-type H+-transporting ATPase subunit b
MPIYLSSSPLIELDTTLVLELAIFIALFFLLKAWVFKPMVALFDAREAATDGAREDAKRMDRDAKDKAQSFEDEMRKIRQKTQEERDQLRQEGVKRERAILDQVRHETQATLSDAERRIKLEAQELRSDLAREVPVLAQSIVAKMLGREATR